MGDEPPSFGEYFEGDGAEGLHPSSQEEARELPTEAAYRAGYRDGFVDATIIEDGYPDETTILKRVSEVNLAEGWEAHQDTIAALTRPTPDLGDVDELVERACHAFLEELRPHIVAKYPDAVDAEKTWADATEKERAMFLPAMRAALEATGLIALRAALDKKD